MTTHSTNAQLSLEEVHYAPHDLIRVNRPILLGLFSLGLSAIATFRNFGTDEDLVHLSYPQVADGWGAWYWFAQLHLQFYVFFFLVTFALAVQMVPLAFPRGRYSGTWPVSAVLFLYVTLWFLFIQTRYGTALAIMAPAAVSGGFLLLVITGVIACLVHKGVAGGILLLLLWRFLEGRKHSLLTAATASAVGIFLTFKFSTQLAILAGYGDYVGWWDETGSSTNTPLKYYYILAVLLAWKLRSRRGPSADGAADRLLILTLLFLPASYYIIFAGRSFQMYSVVFLFTMLFSEVPRSIQILLLVPFVVGLAILLINSGFYF